MIVSLQKRFQEFLDSDDTLRIYRDGQLVFSSAKDKVKPLLEYIESQGQDQRPAVFYDKIMGNAAALLSVKAGAEEAFSPLGSRLGIETLEKYNIRYHFNRIIPFIQKPDSEEMCFMEQLSQGKEPEEFYTAIKRVIRG